MKPAFFTAVAALALSAIAAPTPASSDLPKVPDLGNLGKELEKLPVVSSLLGAASPSSSASPSASSLPKPSGLPLPTPSGGPHSPAPTGGPLRGLLNGHLIQDLAPEVNDVLTVVGPDAKKLLIQLSPEVAGLVRGLIPGLGAPVGSIVASASSVGDLLTSLGPETEGLLTVTGKGVGALLIKLSPDVAGLVGGLLPRLGAPVGSVVATLGHNL